jgi:hypothetical protein
VALAGGRDEVFDQQRNILSPFAERRHIER